MGKYVVIIDNKELVLKRIKNVLEKDAQNRNVELMMLCSKAEEETVFDETIKRFYDLFRNDGESVKLNIIVDVCLTEEEEELTSIKDVKTFTGIELIKKIDEFLKEKTCDYNLFLMSSFFSSPLKQSDIIESFRNEYKNFVTIIRIPVLSDGKIDSGYSKLPDYTDILTRDLLSVKIVQSFKNIVFYKL